MARQAWPTVLTGDSWSAAQHNTYGRDNEAAHWPYTTAGDMPYATASNALARLAIGAAQTLMRSTGTAPAWSTMAALLQLTAMIASQAAGDLFYALSGTTIGRLAKGTALQYLRMNSGATAPEWASVLFPTAINRQGGSATIWSTPGTTTRSITDIGFQLGAANLTTSGGSGAVTITFPTAFSNKPLVFVSFGSNLGGALAYAGVPAASLSTTGFDIDASWSSDGTLVLHWLAIGPP